MRSLQLQSRYYDFSAKRRKMSMPETRIDQDINEHIAVKFDLTLRGRLDSMPD
jgi:hypothetical protein